jgi:hypothetical protein
MMPEEQQKTKNDKATGKIKKREYNIKELVENLLAVRYSATRRKKNSCSKQHKLAIHEEMEAAEEGWLGKPKGLLQVAWE